jgi:uncharacterized protein YidB (DUF937 family)
MWKTSRLTMQEPIEDETMRFIHQVIEDLQGQNDEELSPLAAALKELLGGERGSLAELADRFTEAGFGHIMASWMSKGPALRIGTEDLRRILGEERVQDLATLAGLSSAEFLKRLTRVLPAAVRRMALMEGKSIPPDPNEPPLIPGPSDVV